MIYTHIAQKDVTGVTSPLDLLDGIGAAEVQATVQATVRLQGRSEPGVPPERRREGEGHR